MHLDAASLGPRATYQLMTSLLVPRPIAWTATCSEQGGHNLAPFSYFMGVSSRPPRVAISVARGRGGALKDTARNLLDTRECTISICSWPQLEAMHRTSAPWPSDVSEFEAVGLTPLPSKVVAPPGVAESGVTLEGRLDHPLDLGDVHLFVIEIVAYTLRDDWLLDGEVLRLDPERLRPAPRLGGTYAPVGPEVVLPRATAG